MVKFMVDIFCDCQGKGKIQQVFFAKFFKEELLVFYILQVVASFQFVLFFRYKFFLNHIPTKVDEIWSDIPGFSAYISLTICPREIQHFGERRLMNGKNILPLEIFLKVYKNAKIKHADAKFTRNTIMMHSKDHI